LAVPPLTQADHNVGNHDAARPAQQLRRQKVSQAQDERKSCSRKNTGNRQGKDDFPECLRRSRAQIVRRFNEVARNMLERGINRQECERSIDMGEREHDRERTVEQKVERMPG